MIEKLPFQKDIETKKVLKKTALAERALGELKGVVQKIPKEDILINTLFLQEAKMSSEIENIVTTQDELYKASIDIVTNPNAKEVHNYALAIKEAYLRVKEKQILSTNDICAIYQRVDSTTKKIRTVEGTVLKNGQGKTIYTPPQNYDELVALMDNLEQFINDDTLSDINPIIKMAIIHHQFESIHPFYDGNGRTGRIINIIYLVLKKLLDIPVLYLSSYIIDTKKQYYILLQEVRDNGKWEEWILYMLEGVIKTSQNTTRLIQEILNLMLSYKHQIREKFVKIYSQDLINVLFSHPYTKIEYVADELKISRQTASKYLNQLTEEKLLHKVKVQNTNYYIHNKLLEILKNR